MYENLKDEVLAANQELPRRGLVLYSWGNVSAVDRSLGVVAIKPSGVAYDQLQREDIVVMDLDGNVVDGTLRPSSDTPTHLVLYRTHPNIGAVVHTHSTWATTWAQAGLPIPALGTTHADYFYGDIPCTRELTQDEVETSYEEHTGKVIVETLGNQPPLAIPGILVKGHASFCWGQDASNAVHNAVVLEEVAKIAYATLQMNRDVQPLSSYLLDKHYLRKHGANAYYGQP